MKKFNYSWEISFFSVFGVWRRNILFSRFYISSFMMMIFESGTHSKADDEDSWEQLNEIIGKEATTNNNNRKKWTHKTQPDPNPEWCMRKRKHIIEFSDTQAQNYAHSIQFMRLKVLLGKFIENLFVIWIEICDESLFEKMCVCFVNIYWTSSACAKWIVNQETWMPYALRRVGRG